jgi:hypothetical protein
MLKDFLDIINGVMVCVLLDPKMHCEFIVLTFGRFSLTCLIGVTNVFMFIGMTSPTNVWVNMTALAFVGELGQLALDQAKKGVFGHYIRATVTELNYELSFHAEYPWYIPIIQVGTLIVFGTLSAGAGIAMFVMPGPYCDDAGK